MKLKQHLNEGEYFHVMPHEVFVIAVFLSQSIIFQSMPLVLRDMESLVDKILEGKGGELINRKTNNRDVQEFLSNVPAYMVDTLII